MARTVRYRVSPPLNVEGGQLVLGQEGVSGTPCTSLLLGRLAEQGSQVEVKLSLAKETVLGIFGRRGAGKSYTLGVLLEGLAAAPGTPIGGNPGDRATLIFDTLNIFQHSAVPISEIADEELRSEATKRVGRYGLSGVTPDFSFAMSYPAGHRQPFYGEDHQPFAVDTSAIRAEDYSHLFQIDIYRDPMGHLLLAGMEKTKDSGYAGPDGPVDGDPGAGLAALVECIKHDADLSAAFSPDTRRALGVRLESLAGQALFSDEPTALTTLLAAGTVRVLLLAQLSPPLRSVVAALLIRQVFNQRAAASEAAKALRLDSRLTPEQTDAAREVIQNCPPRTLVCIDEAQGYAPPNKAIPSTEILIQYVKEGRNHGLSLAITTQQPSAIHPDVMSQLDAIVAHRLTVMPDINTTLKSGKSREPDRIAAGGSDLSPADVLRDLKAGQAWVSHGDATRAFLLDVRPRLSAHGGIEG